MKIIMLNQIENQIVEDREAISLQLDEKVLANKQNRDEQGHLLDGFHEEEVNNIVMTRKQLCYQLYNADERIAMLRGLKGKSLTFVNLAVLLIGAEVEIEVVRHAEGEIDEATGYVHNHDSITHNIKSLKLSQMAEKSLQQALDRAMDLLV